MFQWLYDGTIGNLMAPKEKSIEEKVQVLVYYFPLDRRWRCNQAIFLHWMPIFGMDLML